MVVQSEFAVLVVEDLDCSTAVAADSSAHGSWIWVLAVAAEVEIQEERDEDGMEAQRLAGYQLLLSRDLQYRQPTEAVGMGGIWSAKRGDEELAGEAAAAAAADYYYY